MAAGGNPSAEEAEEAVENGAEQVNNVIHSFRLTSTAFDKKSYLTYLKGYMKSIKAKLPAERVEAFEKGASAFAKKIVGNFKDYEFYVGESMNPEGMVVLLVRNVSTFSQSTHTPQNYREDGTTPYLTYWKDGLNGVSIHVSSLIVQG